MNSQNHAPTGSASPWEHVPSEFRPDLLSIVADTEDDLGLQHVFHSTIGNSVVEEQEDQDSHFIETIQLGPFCYKLQLPPDIGALFAHRVWSGSKLLAQYLLENPWLVKEKRTLELGSGTALPSLVSLSIGSQISILTDYPDPLVLQSLRHTVGYNWDSCQASISRVAVLGHEWGSDVSPIFHKVTDMIHSSSFTCTNHQADTVSSSNPFHVILLSECIWNHSCHEKLASSIHSLLHPTMGTVIVTYAHHIPGKELEDDAFFQLCHDRYQFITQHISTQRGQYMWDTSKSIDIYLKIMKR